MLDRPIPLTFRIAVAPASVALVVAAKLAVDPAFGDASPSPYLLITVAVLISALVGGFWPGMLATFLVAGAVDYFFLEPKYSFAGHSSGQYVQLAAFVAEGAAISAAGAIARSSVRERVRLLAKETEIRTIAEDGRRRYHELMEGLGVALYTTDAAGHITFFNDAAAELWGRRPELNSDEWCGSWRLYHPDGRPMPHEECPMAVTLKEGQPVRGAEAIAERPDGTRVNFIPVPTLLRSASGEVTGAVNVLVDITDRKRAEAARQAAEEKYHSIFENAVFGVFQTTPEGQFLSANEALAQMLGYDSAEDLVTTVTDIGQQVHADLARRAEFVRLLDEQGTVSGFAAQARRKDGQVIWLSLSGRALLDADGRATGFEGIAEDTTVRTTAEEQVARLLTMEQTARLEAELGEQRLRFLSEASGALAASLEEGFALDRVPKLAVPELADICEIHTFDADGASVETAISCADPGLAELMAALYAAYTPQEGAAHPLYRLLKRQGSILVSDLHEPALMSLAQNETQRDLLQKLGLTSYMAVPLLAGGLPIGAMTFTAVEAQKRFGPAELATATILAIRVSMALENSRLYAESQRIQDELRAANEAKDEFLGVMSHELRTPITAILGGTRLLRSREGRMDKETRLEILSDMEGESDRMYRMVENLLTLGRLELGQELPAEPVLAQRVLAKLAASFMQRKPERNVEVNVDEKLEAAAAVPAYLELALRNLLSNADKYSPAGELIELVARQTGEELEIAVLDRGPGVNPQEAEAIFDRFYRSKRTSGSTAGIGLGLTVCKRMMEAQGGRVWMRPRKGGGSEIGLTLPVYKNGVE